MLAVCGWSGVTFSAHLAAAPSLIKAPADHRLVAADLTPTPAPLGAWMSPALACAGPPARMQFPL